MRARWILFPAPLLVACQTGEADPTPPPRDRMFVAVEEDGSVAVLDGADGALLATVDLSEGMGTDVQRFAAHNVQGSPDGRSAWVTAVPEAEDGGHDAMEMPEELVEIDTETYEVRSRIELGTAKHVAHVVLDGNTAWVTAFEADQVLEVDTVAGQVVREIALPPGTGPHGLRLTPDGSTLVIAGLGDGSAHLVDTATGVVSSLDLPGLGVQAAVLPDGSAAFVTLYDTRQVARIDLPGQVATIWDLPADSAGPVQIYPTPDSTSVWVADQGFLGGDPAGHRLFELSAVDGTVELVAEVGQAPHGVVVDEDGGRVWSTMLADGTVQAIDAGTGEVLSTTEVGEAPNGISCVHHGTSMP